MTSAQIVNKLLETDDVSPDSYLGKISGIGDTVTVKVGNKKVTGRYDLVGIWCKDSNNEWPGTCAMELDGKWRIIRRGQIYRTHGTGKGDDNDEVEHRIDGEFTVYMQPERNKSYKILGDKPIIVISDT